MVRSYIAQYPVRLATQRPLHVTPGSPVHSNSNLTSLGSIQRRCIYCAKTISSTVYNQALIYTTE